MEFNPNKAPTLSQYATYCPGRHPNFKIHKRIGDAKNAISANMARPPMGGILYEWRNKEWVEIDRRELTHCDDCGAEYKGRPNKVYYAYTSPAYKQPYVCGDCNDSKYGWKVDGRKENAEALLERLGLK